MFNRELFQKICAVECSWEELKRFVVGLSKKELDEEAPFDKYYSLQSILRAIERYQKKEVDEKYLAYWACAYLWILNGDFKTEPVVKCFSFCWWMQCVITDWLDSLAFFDSCQEYYDLKKYKELYTILDRVYRSLEDWTCSFSYNDIGDCNGADVLVLAVNEQTKEFIKLYGMISKRIKMLDVEQLSMQELKEKIIALRRQGYQEVKYYVWEFEEE